MIRTLFGKALYPLAAVAVWLGLTVLALVMIVLHPKNALADLRSSRQTKRSA